MTVPSQIGALGQPCPISCLHRLSQVFRLLAKVRGPMNWRVYNFLRT